MGRPSGHSGGCCYSKYNPPDTQITVVVPKRCVSLAESQIPARRRPVEISDAWKDFCVPHHDGG